VYNNPQQGTKKKGGQREEKERGEYTFATGVHSFDATSYRSTFGTVTLSAA
jgi:hypothetical protein